MNSMKDLLSNGRHWIDLRVSLVWIVCAATSVGCASAKAHLTGPDRRAQPYEDASYSQPDTYSEGRTDSDHDVRGRTGLNTAFHAQFFPNARFELDDDHEQWDDAERYELHLNMHAERDLQVETVTGIYVYYEKKRWEQGAAKVRHESVGIGMEAGALLFPFTYGSGGSFDLAFYPYIRYGIGTSRGRFRNVPLTTPAGGSGLGSGDLGDFRIEGGLGADVRLFFGDRVSAAIGGGVLWWDSLDTAVYSVRSGSGVVLVDDEEIDFEGRDTYLRVLIEIAY